MRTARYARTALAGVLLVAACRDPLQVDNENQADLERALSRPAGVETFIGNAYQAVHNGTHMSTTSLYPQLLTSGMESYSALANFNMGPRGAIPRTPLSNQRGNPAEAGNLRDYQFQHRAARIAAIGIERLNLPGFTLGSPARNRRARAFARFVQGVALGNVAMAYDSGSVIRENDDPDLINPFLSYDSLMTVALGYLDSAIAIANGPDNGFPLPGTWLPGNALSAADFVRLARSYKARLRAGVARTPAERRDTSAGGLVDWSAVIADAGAGIQSDFRITITPAAGWNVSWLGTHYNTGSANWHQMWQFIMGMADTSGAYGTWLATPPGDREPFLVVTPDRRLPRGTTRAAQSANSPRPPAGQLWDSTPYFRNRPEGDDQPGAALGRSFYDFYRHRAIFNAGNVGPYPVMTKAEIDLLAAEGYLRIPTPNVAAAAALIDRTRWTKGGLDSLSAASGVTDTLMLVSGGANRCVPKVPDPATNFTTTKCGTIWDALKWEYRLETAYTGWGMWFFAGRGWGDLPQGTAVQWPVPFQEMDARRQPFYDMGGVGQTGGAAPGNYGLFSGGVY
jgi:hypothetical protein